MRLLPPALRQSLLHRIRATAVIRMDEELYRRIHRNSQIRDVAFVLVTDVSADLGSAIVSGLDRVFVNQAGKRSRRSVHLDG